MPVTDAEDRYTLNRLLRCRRSSLEVEDPGTNPKEDAMAGEGFDARHDYCPDGFRRDAAGWVLGALDAMTAQRFAEHLPNCRACRVTIAELQPAAQALLTHSPPQPPEHLAAATLARVRQAASRTR